jgi:MFS transporter, DHA1 family, inner membrane transport protein
MSFTVYGIASLIIFASGADAGLIAVTAAITLGLGGLLPGSIFAAVPRFAPSPALVMQTVGLIQQASNLGNSLDRLQPASSPRISVALPYLSS